MAAARRVVAQAREMVPDEEEHVFYARELYLRALRAEADAADRARAAHDTDAEQEALRHGQAMAARLRELAESPASRAPHSPRWWPTWLAWTPKWRASRAAPSRSCGARRRS